MVKEKKAARVVVAEAVKAATVGKVRVAAVADAVENTTAAAVTEMGAKEASTEAPVVMEEAMVEAMVEVDTMEGVKEMAEEMVEGATVVGEALEGAKETAAAAETLQMEFPAAAAEGAKETAETAKGNCQKVLAFVGNRLVGPARRWHLAKKTFVMAAG